jgi:hypothetical protein
MPKRSQSQERQRLIAARVRVTERLKVLRAKRNDPNPGRFGLMGLNRVQDCIAELEPLARILGVE